MKKINNLVVFENDKYLLALLKGYSFANNIELIPSEFDMEAVKKLEILAPAIVVIPVSKLKESYKSLETALLRRVCMSKQLKVFGIAQESKDNASSGIAGLVDVVIKNPLDIGEFGHHINMFLLLINNINERRTQGERRSIDRRAYMGKSILDDNDVNNDPIGNQKDFVDDSNKDLHIDQRKKCLFLKGEKVDLTPKEFELIDLLATDADRVFTTEEIIKHLWPRSNRATKSDLYQYMHLLRKKIENDQDDPKWIMTVKGFGYKLNMNNFEKTEIRARS
jgi:DNA-binding response OmpR family regulator